jgi:hypothetical protein
MKTKSFQSMLTWALVSAVALLSAFTMTRAQADLLLGKELFKRHY